MGSFFLEKYQSRRSHSLRVTYLPKQYQTAAEHKAFMKIWQAILPSTSPLGCKLAKTLLLNYKYNLIGTSILLMCVVAFCIAQPLIASFNIDYIQNHHNDIHYGILLYLSTIGIEILNKLCSNQLNYRFSVLGIRICNTLNTMIYYKSLKYSTLVNKSKILIIKCCLFLSPFNYHQGQVTYPSTFNLEHVKTQDEQRIYHDQKSLGEINKKQINLSLQQFRKGLVKFEKSHYVAKKQSMKWKNTLL